MGDRLFGAIIFICSLLFIWGASLTLESFIQDPVGPKVFPYVLGGIGMACAAWLMYRPDATPEWPNKEGGLEIAAAVVVMCVYAFALPHLGFIVASVLGAFYFAWRLGATMMGALIAGFAISFGLYFTFHTVLGLTLARGIFSF